jgi:hypothetical protein
MHTSKILRLSESVTCAGFYFGKDDHSIFIGYQVNFGLLMHPFLIQSGNPTLPGLFLPGFRLCGQDQGVQPLFNDHRA